LAWVFFTGSTDDPFYVHVNQGNEKMLASGKKVALNQHKSQELPLLAEKEAVWAKLSNKKSRGGKPRGLNWRRKQLLFAACFVSSRRSAQTALPSSH